MIFSFVPGELTFIFWKTQEQFTIIGSRTKFARNWAAIECMTKSVRISTIEGMATTLSTAQYSAIQQAITLYTTGTAPENQFHVDAIGLVAPVAAAIGFSASTGAFQQAAEDRPLTTLLALAAFIGHP